MAGEAVCGIYQIISPSGKRYIGSSADIFKRFNEHRGHFKRGDHGNALLRNAARKYGANAMRMEIVLRCERSVLRSLEQLAITHIAPEYNIERTVAKVLHDFWQDPVWRERNARRCSEQNRARMNDPVLRAKNAARLKAIATSPAHRGMLSERMRRVWELGGLSYREKMAAHSGAVFRKLFADPEYRKQHGLRQSKLMKERMKDERVRERMREAGRKANLRPIYCVTLDRYFSSIGEAAELLGVSRSLISKQMRGLQTLSGWKWRQPTDAELVANGVDPSKVRRDRPLSPAQRGHSKPCKPVFCIELGLSFPSTDAAHAAFGLKKSGAIQSAISKRRKGLGYTWRYLAKNEAPEAFELYSFGALVDLRRESRNRPVVCLDTGVEYLSTADAARCLGLDVSAKYSIFDALRGRKTKAYGMRWAYASDKVPDDGQETAREPTART